MQLLSQPRRKVRACHCCLSAADGCETACVRLSFPRQTQVQQVSIFCPCISSAASHALLHMSQTTLTSLQLIAYIHHPPCCVKQIHRVGVVQQAAAGAGAQPAAGPSRGVAAAVRLQSRTGSTQQPAGSTHSTAGACLV
jgi:hypothetical protein